MKRFLFISIILWKIIQLECLSAENPIDKGVYGIGGNISIGTEHVNSEYGKYDLVSSDFHPSILYFLFPGFAIGSTIEYSWTKSSGILDFKSESWGFGPHVRYYYLNKEYKSFIYVDYQYHYYKYTTVESNYSSQRTNKLSLGTGIDFFIVKNVALEPSLEYFTYRPNTDNTSKGLEFNVGLNIFIY